MSGDQEFKTIEFNWKIENFSYRKEESLVSPGIGSNFPLDLFLSNTNYYISLTVRSFKFSINNLSKCLVAFLDSDGTPLIWKERKIDPNGTGGFEFNSLIATDVLKSNKAEFLPNDTLTIQCHLWQTQTWFTASVSRFALTRFEPPARKTFTWEVVGVSSLQPLQSFERSETMSDGELITIKLSLNKGGKFEVSTTQFKIKKYARIEIAVLDSSGEKMIEIGNFQNQFGVADWCGVRPQQCHIFTKLKKYILTSYSNHFLPADVLSLQFTIHTFSGNVISNHRVEESENIANFLRTTATTVDVSEISEAAESGDEPEIYQPTATQSSNTITQDLQEVFEDGFLSDFNLRVGDRVFPVHKVILGARSRVFRAMFTKEMKEKANNCVDIRDVDEYTLQRLLQFVYLDRLAEDMGWENAFSLYAAAAKFALEPLKQGCSSILKLGLCVLNVFEVLSLADMHQDTDMKSEALNFISLNEQDIIGSESWMKFEEENAKLAVEAYRKLYSKKING